MVADPDFVRQELAGARILESTLLVIIRSSSAKFCDGTKCDIYAEQNARHSFNEFAEHSACKPGRTEKRSEERLRSSQRVSYFWLLPNVSRNIENVHSLCRLVDDSQL